MTSEIEILIRFATGEPVHQKDVLRLVYQYSTVDKSESRRHEIHARRKFRNASLLKAAVLLGTDEPGAWRLAERLEVAVKRFHTRVWPRLKAGGSRLRTTCCTACARGQMGASAGNHGCAGRAWRGDATSRGATISVHWAFLALSAPT